VPAGSCATWPPAAATRCSGGCPARGGRYATPCSGH